MRTILLYVPALICAGSMFVCIRMMSRGHREKTRHQHHNERTTEPRDEEHV